MVIGIRSTALRENDPPQVQGLGLIGLRASGLQGL